MKKNVLLLFAALLIITNVFSQQTESKFSAQISFGAAIPVGKFAGNSAKLYWEDVSEATGMAKTGPAVQIGLNYRIKKAWGLSFLIGGQENKQDRAAFISDARQLTNSTTDQFVLNTNSWKIFRVMAGGYYDIPVAANKLYFRPKLMIGVLKTSIPAYSFFDATTYGFSEDINATPLPVSFCYEVGAALQWQVSKRIFVSADLGYFHSEPAGYTLRGVFSPPHQNTKVPISSVTTLAGIGYRF